MQTPGGPFLGTCWTFVGLRALVPLAVLLRVTCGTDEHAWTLQHPAGCPVHVACCTGPVASKTDTPLAACV
jgi:hypothetical protein